MALWEQEGKALEICTGRSQPEDQPPPCFKGPKTTRQQRRALGTWGLGLPWVPKEAPGEWLHSAEPGPRGQTLGFEFRLLDVSEPQFDSVKHGDNHCCAGMRVRAKATPSGRPQQH